VWRALSADHALPLAGIRGKLWVCPSTISGRASLARKRSHPYSRKKYGPPVRYVLNLDSPLAWVTGAGAFARTNTASMPKPPAVAAMTQEGMAGYSQVARPAEKLRPQKSAGSAHS